MKLNEAKTYIAAKYPGFLHEADDAALLAVVTQRIADANADARALQVIAHSLRTRLAWATHRKRPRKLTREELKTAPLASLTLQQLHQRAGLGGDAETRALINAEIRKRVIGEDAEADWLDDFIGKNLPAEEQQPPEVPDWLEQDPVAPIDVDPEDKL